MIEVARFFLQDLTSIFRAKKVQNSKTLEPPGVDGDRLCGGPDSAKSSGCYSMNTQKLVVKHLVQN